MWSTHVGQPGLDGEDHRGLPGLDGLGELVDFRRPARRTECVEPVQGIADPVGQPAAAGARQHIAQEFFGEPRGGDVAVWVRGGQLVEQLRALLVGEPFGGAQQPAPVDPLPPPPIKSEEPDNVVYTTTQLIGTIRVSAVNGGPSEIVDLNINR